MPTIKQLNDLWLADYHWFKLQQKVKMEITEEGYWKGIDVVEHHYFDEKVFNSILSFCTKYSIQNAIDLGCGKGDYVKSLNQNNISTIGYDGNPDTFTITDGLCNVLELQKPFFFIEKYDLVLSLEVGEHIPKQFENIYIDNITSLVGHKKFLIISWAVPNQGGHGHVNCKSNTEIIEQLQKRNFEFNSDETQKLRKNTDLFWFKDTLMVFQKI